MISPRSSVHNIAAALVILFLLTGCATNRVNWSERVGTYNYEQAILELGPPDKQAKLQSGTIVAEWLTNRGYSYAYNPYGFGYYPYYGFYYPHVETFSAPDAFLRLTFSPDGYLQAWKKFYR